MKNFRLWQHFSKADYLTEIKQSIRRSIKQITKSDLDLLNSTNALSSNQFYKIIEMIDQNEILRRIGHYTYLKNLGIKQISDSKYDLIDKSRDLKFHLELNDWNEIAVSTELSLSSIAKFDSLDAFELSKIAMFMIKDNQLKISAYRFKGSEGAFQLIDKLIKICEELKQSK